MKVPGACPLGGNTQWQSGNVAMSHLSHHCALVRIPN